jgi:hypothetical protein
VLAVGTGEPMKTYTELLAIAKATDSKEDWAVVTAIEHGEMAKRCVPEPVAAEYLRRRPLCASCEARGVRAEATHVIYAAGPEQGDGDDNLMPLCKGSLYVLVAREAGWPVRGCDVNGMPNDPDHPWNAEG